MSKPVGIDVGYGFVKVFDRQDNYQFPSVVGLAEGAPRYGGLSAGSRVRNLSVTVDGATYHVGELAIRQSSFAFRSLSQSRLEANEFKVLCLAGLGLLADRPVTSMSVVTGLPPGLIYQERSSSQLLKGDHHILLTVGRETLERTIQVEQVEILPQPMGTYFAEALDSKGQVRDERLIGSRVAIVDIGYGTTDLVAVDGGEYVSHLSRTVPVGLSTVYAHVGERLQREYGLLREAYLLDEAITTGAIRVAGQNLDITAIRDQAYQSLATKLITEIYSTWDPRSLDAVLFTGGGSMAVDRFLLPHFTNARRVENSQTANARGFLLWAERLFSSAAAEAAAAAHSGGGVPNRFTMRQMR